MLLLYRLPKCLVTIWPLTDIMSDELSEPNVTPVLTTNWLGRPYLYTAAIASTNDELKTLSADPDVASGTVLLADYQSSGRGRMQRRWETPPGSSLLFSALFRPNWPARQSFWLMMLAGLAVTESIEATTGLDARLKWPNDVVIELGGQWRKLCGLLLDVALSTDGRVESAVLGVGLNVNISAEDLPEAVTPPASLLVAAGRPVPRVPLLVELLQRMERHYDAALAGLSPVEAWSERLVTLGRAVRVTAAGSAEALTGVAESVDAWGRLLVRDEAGILHAVAAGDVTLR